MATTTFVRTLLPVVVIDRELVVRQWSAGLERLTGRSVSDAVGRPCFEVVGAANESPECSCRGDCTLAEMAWQGTAPEQCNVALGGGLGDRVVMRTLVVSLEGRDTLIHIFEPAGGQPARPRPGTLTARQAEVMRLVAQGLTSWEIAERLSISPATARNHVRASLQRLGATNRAEAVAIAIGTGEISV